MVDVALPTHMAQKDLGLRSPRGPGDLLGTRELLGPDDPQYPQDPQGPTMRQDILDLGKPGVLQESGDLEGTQVEGGGENMQDLGESHEAEDLGESHEAEDLGESHEAEDLGESHEAEDLGESHEAPNLEDSQKAGDSGDLEDSQKEDAADLEDSQKAGDSGDLEDSQKEDAADLEEDSQKVADLEEDSQKAVVADLEEDSQKPGEAEDLEDSQEADVADLEDSQEADVADLEDSQEADVADLEEDSQKPGEAVDLEDSQKADSSEDLGESQSTAEEQDVEEVPQDGPAAGVLAVGSPQEGRRISDQWEWESLARPGEQHDPWHWTTTFQHYMNALLADLQSTITPARTASPPPPAHNGPAHTPPPPTAAHNHAHNGHEMYHQERVEEVRTEQRSSGGGKKSSFNNNLSELDSLLQDLNNARYTGNFKEPGAATNGTVDGTRPSVDSLLDELNSVDTSHEVVEHRTVHHEFTTTHQTLPQAEPQPQVSPRPHPSASTATKELDDLMASLSDFKRSDVTQCERQVLQTGGHVRSQTKIEEAPGPSPPRPPAPADADVLAVPPPRPPAPQASPLPPEAYLYVPPLVSIVPAWQHGTPRVGGGIVIHHIINSPADDPFNRPPSGGPVKRNDAEYRWVTDETKYEAREVIDFPCVSERVSTSEKVCIPEKVCLFERAPAAETAPAVEKAPTVEKVPVAEKVSVVERAPAVERAPVVQAAPAVEKAPVVDKAPATQEVYVSEIINASTLQTQVDSAYAKPQKPAKSPSPPEATSIPSASPSPVPAPSPPKEPTPTPTPPPPNQLDSMLGSLASHMTEQGITTTQKGCCCACDKPIVGQVITALGKTWHPEHFTCTHCNQELGTRNFFEREGRPYCEPDYHNLFSPRCAYCNGPILDKCVTALDKTWHPEHFFCTQCGNTFGDDGFHEKDGKPYCRDDYFNMFAPKCGGCNSPIMENYISALNAQWHPECFVCRDCRQPFNGGSFFDHEGLPYCETHYHAKRGSLCAGCNKPITGRCITAMFRKFHPEHFVCSFCLKQLNKGTFKEQNDKPYCHGCFDKLFG
ncbi:uncharacterized protein [Panulirus ornatus]|uniref:uncharacterized protein isoform X3 n=1 Tax=Panulirus ornatus TaxID=150431 RepID=UPI003A869153